MTAVRCRFCNHPNPEGARFCNECAEPLRMQPCRQCDAVDQRTAAQCYKCGAPFPDASADRVPETVEQSADTAGRIASAERPGSAPGALDARRGTRVEHADRPAPDAGSAPMTSLERANQVLAGASSRAGGSRSAVRSAQWNVSAWLVFIVAAAAVATWYYRDALREMLQPLTAARSDTDPGAAGRISGTSILETPAPLKPETPRPGGVAQGSGRDPAVAGESTPSTREHARGSDPQKTSDPSASGPVRSPSATPRAQRPVPATLDAEVPLTTGASAGRAPTIAECTEALAALGLCNPSAKDGER